MMYTKHHQKISERKILTPSMNANKEYDGA